MVRRTQKCIDGETRTTAWHDLYGDLETYGWEREAKHQRQDRYIGRLDFSGGAEDSGGRATT
ncbi:hypothetical protein AB0O72_22950 [Streptomyces sp. NPDC088106]|uniref:hypothetical protein n=1 Tax=unclassified Streptomyces TaxID=2593676 RepID=UPI003432071C